MLVVFGGCSEVYLLLDLILVASNPSSFDFKHMHLGGIFLLVFNFFFNSEGMLLM